MRYEGRSVTRGCGQRPKSNHHVYIDFPIRTGNKELNQRIMTNLSVTVRSRSKEVTLLSKSERWSVQSLLLNVL